MTRKIGLFQALAEHINYFWKEDKDKTLYKTENVFLVSSESIATLPPFGPIEGQKWFDQIPSQWESQKNRFALISFGKIQFLPPCIWISCSCRTVSGVAIEWTLAVIWQENLFLPWKRNLSIWNNGSCVYKERGQRGRHFKSLNIFILLSFLFVSVCFGWSSFCFGSIETPKLAVSV